MLFCFFLYGSGNHRCLNFLTHSFPTPRSSDLASTDPGTHRPSSAPWLRQLQRREHPQYRQTALVQPKVPTLEVGGLVSYASHCLWRCALRSSVRRLFFTACGGLARV